MSKVEASIIQKAQESGDIRNSAAPYALIRVSKTLFLGTLAMWTSMSGEFDFEKAMRAGLEICFDVKPEIRQGDECYLRLPEN